MKILVYVPYGDSGGDLRQMVCDAAGEANTVVFPSSKEELIEEGKEAEVLYGSCSEEIFQRLPKLKWLQSSSAGMDKLLYSALKESDILLTNAAGLYASHATEHAFALLLGLARGIHRFVHHQSKHEWANREWGGPQIIEIGGWTLGIIGMGGFGTHMARRAKGFDMRVVAVDAYRTDPPAFVDELMPIDQLPDLMRRCDVVMIACPLTQETYHLINAENLALMKPTAYLINVARGRIVDEGALIEVLQGGKIAGAGLDVCEEEPLPDDSPLWDLDNVIVTPHIAGASQHRPRRAIEFFCDNLKRYIKGEPLKNVVDKQLGF